MSIPLLEVVEGWTGALPFTLLADDVAVDLTGLTVSIILKDGNGNTVKSTTAGIAVVSSTSGTITYSPSSSSGDLFVAAKTPYKVRFKAANSTGSVVFFPNGDEDVILVNTP